MLTTASKPSGSVADVCVCVCTFVHMCGGQRSILCVLYCSPLYLFMTPELISSPNSRLAGSPPTPQCWGYRHTWSCPFFKGVGGLNLGLRVCSASILSNRTISSAPFSPPFSQAYFSPVRSSIIQISNTRFSDWPMIPLPYPRLSYSLITISPL